MTNDKLPEDIQRQIEHEASKANEHLKEGNDYQCGYSKGIEYGYEQGATAWAPWKVRFDELNIENEKLNESCNKLFKQNCLFNNEIVDLKNERQQLMEQAQCMADALEEMAESNCDYESTNYAKALHSPECRACKAKELLQQFKDGGKEVGKKEPTISKCGMCHKDGVNQYLGNQFYLCDECFENYENSRDQP